MEHQIEINETIAVLLQEEILNYKDVIYCAYSKDHPSDELCRLKIISNIDPIEIIKRAKDNAKIKLNKIKSDFIYLN